MPTGQRIDPASGLFTMAAYDVSLEAYGDGVAIDTLTDRTGHGYTVTGTTTARPTCRTNRLNGFKIAAFDGSNDRMVAATAAPWQFLHDGHGWTILLVVRQNSGALVTAFAGLLSTEDFVQTHPGVSLYLHASGGRGGFFGYLANTSASDVMLLTPPGADLTVTPLGWHILVAQYQPKRYAIDDFGSPVHDLRLFVDGIGIGGAKWNTAAPHATVAPQFPLTLGSLGDGSSPCPMDLAACAILKWDTPADLLQAHIRYYQDRFDLGYTVPLAQDGAFNGSAAAYPLPNGEWIGTYSKFPTESALYGDDIALMVRSGDQGHTWGMQSLLYTAPGVDVANSEFFRTAAGTLIVGMDLYPVALPSPTGGILRSTDNGYTWGSLVSLFTPSGLTGGGFQTGTFTQLSNGTLLTTFQGFNTGETLWSVKILQSVNDGVTWTLHSTLISGPVSGKKWLEGSILKVAGTYPTETILSVVNETTTGTIAMWRSTNSGTSWTGPTTIRTAHSARSSLWQGTSGNIFHLCRHDVGNWRAVVYWSGDLGLTWSTQEYWPDGVNGVMQYGQGFEVPGKPGFHYICFSGDATATVDGYTPHMQLPRGMVHREADIIALP